MASQIRRPVGKKVVKVPVVIQMEALECGVACLAMVLAYCGRYEPLEQLREDCNVNRDGVSAGVLVKVAKHYGLDASPVRANIDALREHGTFPCILFWENKHFVILRGFQGKKAYLNDPARGAYSVSMEEFERCYTGICVFFEPTDSFEPGGRPETFISLAKRNMKGASGAFAFVAFATFLTTLVGIFNPMLTQVFIDQVLSGGRDEWLPSIIAGMSALLVVGLAVNLMIALTNLRISAKLTAMRSTAFFEHILKMPMGFFFQRGIGDLQSRQESSENLTKSFVNILASFVLNFVMLLLYLVVIIKYSPLLSAIGILNLLINLVVTRLLAVRQREIFRVLQRDLGILATASVEGIHMAETIKANGAEVGYFGKWADLQAKSTIEAAKSDKVTAYLSSISGFVSSLSSILVLLMGVYLIIAGNFTAGALMAFQSYLQKFIAPANSLINANASLINMRSEVERVDDVMNHALDPLLECDAPRGEQGKLSGQIELRNVTYGYSRFKDPLIKDCSFTILPGQTVAFVGASGCGKSTVANIVSGIFAPQTGEVLFDGIPIADIDRGVFTSSVTMVDQEIMLFEESILENIRMLDTSIGEDAVKRAAKDACIHDDIMILPGNYHSIVREGGSNFSGGQRQRIEIARAIVGDPSVIILDEATSALDTVTEADIMHAVKNRRATCIIIAHRLSTVRDCDCIYVLKEGAIVQAGTHDELAAQDGLYRDLLTEQ